MDLAGYQERAKATDQRPADDRDRPGRSADAFVIPLLGIGGELGTLQSEYKKYLRDGDAYAPFRDHIKEELGDILWYVANLASKFDLPLDEIAANNLEKIEDRWGEPAITGRKPEELFDRDCEPDEQLPRTFEVEFRSVAAPERPEPIMQAFWEGRTFGDPLGDNAYDDDGYRYHDAFHLAHAAILGWSPVCRRTKQFDRKRRNDKQTDAVEDGGRAIVIEEAIVAYVYGHARDHGWFEHVDAIDFAILKTIRGLTTGLEVEVRRARDWERAIFEGYRVWLQLWRNGGGVVIGDMRAATIEYRPLDQ